MFLFWENGKIFVVDVFYTLKIEKNQITRCYISDVKLYRDYGFSYKYVFFFFFYVLYIFCIFYINDINKLRV